MSEMEPEVRTFLAKIATSVSVAALWLLVNSTLGIAFDLAFFKTSPAWFNWLFYVWFVTSLFFLIKYLLKKWR